MEVLFSDQIPDPREVAIIGLANVCGILSEILTEREIESVMPRIEQVRKLDLIGQEVALAVRDIEASIAYAMHPAST